MSVAFSLLAAIVAMVLLPGTAAAQVLYGSIVGTVTDPTGATVANARVVATRTATGEVREASTDPAGRFVISDAWPGGYDLKINAPGFRAYLKTSVGVSINTVTRVDAQLELGGLAEQVTVVAAGATVQTDKADVHVELSEKAVRNLPLPNYRNYQTLINLVPGATPAVFQNAVTDTPGRALSTNINGTNRNNNTTRVDGAAAINIFLPHHTLYVAPVESIEAVSVATASFDAEQGMAGGAAITVNTKSGTNEFHGSAFGFHNNNHLRARNFFYRNPSKAKSIINIVGGTLGGPIRRNKLFFFSSWEGTFERVGWSGLFTVPTADQRNGNFSTYGAMIYDPATGNPNGSGRNPFPGATVPLSRQSSITRAVQDLVPMPNQAGTVSNYFNSGTQALSRNNIDLKVNWNRTGKHSIWGKYSVMEALVNCGYALGNAGASGSCDAGRGHSRNQLATLGHTWTVSPRLVIDGTLGVGREGQDIIATEQFWGKNIGRDVLGIPGTNGDDIRYSGIPTFSITGYQTLGIPEWQPQYKNNLAWTHTTNMGWVRGAHEMRWGFDLVRLNLNHWMNAGIGGARGAFTFDGAIAALNGGPSPNQFNAYAAFLLGLPQSARRTLQPLMETGREWQFGWYFRDRWQATRKLTFSLGLRYELYPYIHRRDTGIERYDPITNQVLLGGIAGNPDSLGVSTSHRLFAPRFGFAWRLTEGTVIRSGYGITYDPMPLSRPFFGWYPILISNTFVGPSTFVPFAPIEQGIPLFGLPDLSSGVVPLPPDAVMRSPWKGGFHRGYIQSWNFIVERRLPASFVASMGYVGTQTVHQLVDQNINAAGPGAGAVGRPLYAAFRRTADTNMLDGWLSAHYHSLQVTLNRSLAQGLLVKGAYTFSKAINMTDDDGWASLPLFNWGPAVYRNRALAGFDRSHILQFAWVYELPFGNGRKYASSGLVSRLAEGWQVNGIFSAYSGTPFNVTASAASVNAPGNSQTADQVLPAVKKLGGIGPNVPFFDPLAFRAVTDVRFGNTGRNILRGPGVVNVNASLFRLFPLTERFKMEFRAEVHNFSNTPHFNNPAANASNMRLNPDGSLASLGNFLSITAAQADERQFRLGLRLSF
jgi:hypothetical protein